MNVIIVISIFQLFLVELCYGTLSSTEKSKEKKFNNKVSIKKKTFFICIRVLHICIYSKSI